MITMINGLRLPWRRLGRRFFQSLRLHRCEKFNTLAYGFASPWKRIPKGCSL